MKLLLGLIIGHYLADFGLQNDYIATTKAPGSANWVHSMVAHCAIQALPVLYLTGSPLLTALEFGAHFGIDCLKCKGRIGFTIDQSLHLLCKLAWWGAFTWLI